MESSEEEDTIENNDDVYGEFTQNTQISIKNGNEIDIENQETLKNNKNIITEINDLLIIKQAKDNTVNNNKIIDINLNRNKEQNNNIDINKEIKGKYTEENKNILKDKIDDKIKNNS